MRSNKKRKIFLCISSVIFLIIGVLFIINSTLYKLSNVESSNDLIASSTIDGDFPDENFYKCVVDAYNSTNSASVAYTESLTDAQLRTIKRLSCTNSKINSVVGIEKLFFLKELYVGDNKLESIDVTKNSELTILSVYGNKLETLDITKNTNLTSLYAQNNQLSTLNLTYNTKLETLYLMNNKLANLDVSKNTKLSSLAILGNSFTESGVIYKGDNYSLIPTSVKIPTSKKIIFKDATHPIDKTILSNNNIVFNEKGDYQINVSYKHNIQTASSDFAVLYNVKVIEATSSKYEINEEKGYINTKSDTDSSTILKNIELNYGEGKIESNKYNIYYDGKLIKTFDIKQINTETTSDYLKFDSSLEVNESKKYISNVSLNTTVSKLLKKIDTNGTVTVKNNNGTIISDNAIVGTGSKVIIKLMNTQ